MSDVTTAPDAISQDGSRWADQESQWAPVFEWVERRMSGTIVSIHRQARWRPCWFISLRLADGSVKDVYLRSQREEDLPWIGKLSLDREYRIHSVLQREGVKVPPVIDFLPDPGAVLMKVVTGRDRFDERDDSDTRDVILEQYIDILASAHRIDPEEFVKVGLRRPETPREIGYGGFVKSEQWYRELKDRPQPVGEFLVKWIHRNVPEHRDQVTWNTWDAGQFLHEDGRCKYLMDVEFSMLGDPFNDLGAMRYRDSMQGIGNLTRAYRRYAEVTGQSLDKAAINFHAVTFAAITVILASAEIADPKPEFDVAEWASWSLVAQIVALEVIAEEMGIELDAPEPMPDLHPSRYDFLLLSPERVLADVVGDVDDEFTSYRIETARELVESARRADAIAAALEERDRADEETLLGIRPESWNDGDRLLEKHVLAAGPEKDAELVRFLHRRVMRQRHVLEPAMREMRALGVQRVGWQALAPHARA